MGPPGHVPTEFSYSPKQAFGQVVVLCKVLEAWCSDGEAGIARKVGRAQTAPRPRALQLGFSLSG